MKWSNVRNLLYLFFKVFNRVFLALLLLLGVAAFAFDRLVAAEISRAFPARVTITDAQLRRSILETFPFRAYHAKPVFDVFEQEHPHLKHFLGRGVAWGLVGWCVYLHESSRLEATLRGTSCFDQNDEFLDGLDAASKHWLHHGIESATAAELQVLKEQLVSSKHPSWRRHSEKHPAGDGG